MIEKRNWRSCIQGKKVDFVTNRGPIKQNQNVIRFDLREIFRSRNSKTQGIFIELKTKNPSNRKLKIAPIYLYF